MPETMAGFSGVLEPLYYDLLSRFTAYMNVSIVSLNRNYEREKGIAAPLVISLAKSS
jgi:hypothetical protein